MKELIFEQTGQPLEVLQLKESPIPTPKSHEVLIRVTARNINPSDIMFVRGMYGITPKLPSSAGFEASGVVEKGDEAGKVKTGSRVMFTAIGTWREYLCLSAAMVIPVPDAMPDEVACQAFVNPMTAFAMVEKSGLKEGEWLLITAGASAFGKFAIQLAKAKGIKVAATVRHDSQREVLDKLGVDLVINTETEKIQKLVPEKTDGGVHVIFDAVGGMLGAKALSCLRPKGRMMVFGALALDNMPINSGLLIFKDLKIEGFWLSTWMEEQNDGERAKAFRSVFGFLMNDNSQIDIAGKFKLEDFRDALKAYAEPGRNGKILLIS
ncbi:MAG: zinc-dependent alcohol dehydrogenase family protein [Algoriphagus sp.]|uniref:zinc-dependent alcohol dehydrogenase family protein n=1 Tax=Algoriphagus sp. TaxID=1872435 RepID=UPI00272F9066|nr:zinc-dependent alcohol dehydrogenase family protein [Algoriphagus sp.]MDP2040751.1 zinc-dependent alcohol dehydrogenase family protein [Algoriphagus sp.]MDP3473074.1 zinc-dependent alcohol dehydrogenase family protein [Algoriphagus sp.]